MDFRAQRNYSINNYFIYQKQGHEGYDLIDLRQYLIMEESKAPAEWTGIFTNIENNGAPWQFAQADRLKWKDEE